MAETIKETPKAFAFAYRNSEEQQAYISASRCSSSVIVKALKHGMGHVCPFLLNQSIQSYDLSLLPLFLPPLPLIFSTTLLPKSMY